MLQFVEMVAVAVALVAVALVAAALVAVAVDGVACARVTQDVLFVAAMGGWSQQV